MLEYEGIEIRWEGHASLRFEDEGFSVAVDPYGEVSDDRESDLILITHADEGHFDPGQISSICSEKSCVVVPGSIPSSSVPCKDVEVIEEGEVLEIFGVEIEAVPMYNEHHQKGEGIGYVFKMADTTFYAAGDTGPMREMLDLENRIDLAFLPVEGVYTMDEEEAVKSAVKIKPEKVIPYHYGRPFFTEVEPDLDGMKAELEDRNIGFEVLGQD